MPNCIKNFKDKEKARRYRNKHRAKNYNSSLSNATKSGKRWTDNDIALLFNRNCTDRELSKQIGRSIGAIQVKRCKTIKPMHR